MMDRFNFRFWHEAEKRWFYFNFNNFEMYQDRIQKYCLDDGKKIYQCTGLKDKNGKLFYEGDVVKCLVVGCMPVTDGFGRVDYGSQHYKEYQLGIIIYNTDRAEFVIDHPRWCKRNLYQYKDIEIIGSIYENKELLTQ